MNYLAHAIPFFENPYFAASTGIPDWLSVIDRRVRLRSKQVAPFWRDPDPIVAAVASGVAQHLCDDARFHGTHAFFEVSNFIGGRARAALHDEHGLRSNFLGHLLGEVLLDASLAEEDPGRIERYYQTLETIDPALIQKTVNRMAPRETLRLAFFIKEFCRAKILWDYLEDAKLMVRMNQVMHRVGLPLLPNSFASILPEARQFVSVKKAELLEGIPGNFRELFPEEDD